MLKTSSGDQSGRDGQSGLAVLEQRLVGSDPDDSAIPASMRKAVRFMLGGALVRLVTGLFTIIAVAADPRLINNGKQPTSALSGVIVEIAIVTLVYTALWVVMARTNRSGRSWARIVASVLFAISTYSIVSSISGLHDGQYVTVATIVGLVLGIVEWLCGLGAIAMLWRGASSVYFKSRAAER